MDNRSNINAATGFGQFDLQLARNVGILNIIIKVRLVDPNGYVPDLGAYMNAWQRNINQFWSNKMTFRHPGLQRDVTARFVLQRVNAGEHFAVLITMGYDGGAGVKFAAVAQGILQDPAGVGAGNVYLALGQTSNMTFAAFQTMMGAQDMVGGTRRNALNALHDPVRLLTGVDFLDVTLDRNGNAWTVALGSRPALDNFCLAVNNSGVTGQPLYVHSQSGLQNKADALADCVIQYIRARGVTNQINANPEKLRRKLRAPWTGHKGTATVRVELEDVDTAFARWYGNYTVSAHEFGHLIGIPDEYLDYSGFTNATIRNSQPLWDNLCNTWHLTPRNWHTQFNDSIMSIGTRIYPAHAATIIDALDNMTRQAPNALAANSWTLVTPR